MTHDPSGSEFQNGRRDEPTSSDWGQGGLSRNAAATCRDFLGSMGQTVKLISLYQPDHPVAKASLQETWKHLRRFFADTGWPEMELSLSDSRLLVNGTPLADASQLPQALVSAFKTHEIYSIWINKGTLFYELTTFVELAAVPAAQAEGINARDFLKQKGIRNIRLDLERFSRASERTNVAPPKIESPIPQRKKTPAKAAPSPNQGFGSFLKSLVEDAIDDPEERAKIYGEALKTVKQAVDKRVKEATRKLRSQKRVVQHEQVRTEKVLAAVADGKIIVDREGKVLMMDPVAEQITGKRLVDLAGKPLLENVKDGDQMAAVSKDIQVSAEKAPSGEVKMEAPKNVNEALRNSLALVHDEKGRVVGTYFALPHSVKYKETERMQEEFVSHVTHELKAPLASICSALELIEQMAGPKLKPQEKKFLDISRRNSTRLKGLIDEILTFSKIQSGEMKIHSMPCGVGPILLEGVEGLRPWAESKGISLTVDASKLDKEHSTVKADHGRIVQVLTNLISNAIKNTPKGGAIKVTALPSSPKTPGHVVFSVKDTGKGIEKAEQEAVFKRFMQLKNGNKAEGVGLGLHISRELIMLHKGQLWLQSEVGKGSNFMFSIPIAEPTQSHEPARPLPEQAGSILEAAGFASPAAAQADSGSGAS